MGEIISIRINPIVAIQACIPECRMVVEHKGHVHLFMAVITDHWIKGSDIIPMTISTQEGFIPSFFLMSVQQIPGDLMRKPPIFDHCEHRMGPIMLRVTVTTSGSRIKLVQLSVNGTQVSQFGRNIRMAGIAAIIHTNRFPGSGMTQLAIPRYFCMRGYATQNRTRFSIQFPRAEHRSTAGKSYSRKCDDSDQGSNEPCTRKTTQPV